MAQTLSLSAASAGVISLGITTCQGLVKYCKSYRGRDQKIKQLSSRAENLGNILTHLHNATEQARGVNESTRQLVEENIENCNGRIKELQNLVQKAR